MRGSIKLLIAILAMLLLEYVIWLCSGKFTEEKTNTLFVFSVFYIIFCITELPFRNNSLLLDEPYPAWLKYLNIITLFQFIIRQADEHL